MVDLSERFANVGYHDENWQARTCCRVSSGKIGVAIVAIVVSSVIAPMELAPNRSPCTALGLEPPLAVTLVTLALAGYGGFLFFRVSLDRRDVVLPVTQIRPTDARVDVRRRARGRDRRTDTSIPKTPAVSHAPYRIQQLQVDPQNRLFRSQTFLHLCTCAARSLKPHWSRGNSTSSSDCQKALTTMSGSH